MQKCIAIQANSIDRINVETDTSLLLALEAQKRDGLPIQHPQRADAQAASRGRT